MGKGERRLFQYAIFVNNSNYPYKQYVWASEEEIRNVIDEIMERSPSIVGGRLFYRNAEFEVNFHSQRIGSLEIKAKNFESATNGFMELSERTCRE